ncbi:MAG: undecaprenyl-diphosphate phosphatase, partial [Elusimicrobiaceae bacterium]|nr:undecaprenyl-diphosphate phosphatase [Elusimicrobiaceae bacterium]
QGLAFDVMLHAATLLAVLLYFWKDWWVLLQNGLTKPTGREGKTLWYLAAATLPAALAGFLLNDWAEHTFRNPLMIAGCLIIFACILWLADHHTQNAPDTEIFDVPFLTVFLIGCAQALAIMPGVSRSGITITAALFLGLGRSISARISFLLSAPIIAGAAILEATKLSLADFNLTLLAGFMTAFVAALVVIGWLMIYIKTHSFDVFVYYRILLGLFIIGFYLWK